MSAVWHKQEGRWELLAPEKFDDEKTLHELIDANPKLLPLAGKPELVVAGSEVRLGTGFADLVALEPEGRVAIIEVKLARNSEARRAVVAQVLAYCAFLHTVTVDVLEKDILGSHLRQRDYQDLTDAMEKNDQEGSFDRDTFLEGLRDCLDQGSFRLVFVLDSVPEDLTRLVGFLDTVANRLIIDLVSVSQYEAGGQMFLVPQRIEPDKEPTATPTAPTKSKATGQEFEGVEEFTEAIEDAPEDERPRLHALVEWALSLEEKGYVRLKSYRGVNRWTMLPTLKDIDSGLVTLWSDKGASIQYWKSVFEKKAPNTLPKIEAKIAPTSVGQGNTIREFDDELLALLTAAYAEAVGGG